MANNQPILGVDVYNDIKDSFKPKVHYYEYGDSQRSKRSLSKAGAEFINARYGGMVIFQKSETTVVDGDVLFTVECGIHFGGEMPKACGFGGAMKSEFDGGDFPSWNTAVKLAAKRAYVDATIRRYCLSEFFTQDFEDSNLKASGPVTNPPRKYERDTLMKQEDKPNEYTREDVVMDINGLSVQSSAETFAATLGKIKESISTSFFPDVARMYVDKLLSEASPDVIQKGKEKSQNFKHVFKAIEEWIEFARQVNGGQDSDKVKEVQLELNRRRDIDDLPF